MAEIGRDNATRPALFINLEGTSNNNNNNLQVGDNRYSVGSAGSNHSQYLMVYHRGSWNSEQQLTTPTSVSPFSPSESFAFPKPPEPAAASTGSISVSVASGSSIPTSNATCATLGHPPPPPGLRSVPSFASLVPSSKKSPIIVTPRNPFEDPTIPTISNLPYLDIPVEVVRRPFEPTLPDELAVKLGDRVRVLETFDDGWGLIEKVGGEDERGVIPMDRLRMAGELEELGTGTWSNSCEVPCAV